MEIQITYNIYEERIKQKLTVRDLADKSGVSKTQINDIENGIKHPTVYSLCCIAVALGVNPSCLFDLSVIADK